MPRRSRSIVLLAGAGQLPIDIWRTAKKRGDKIVTILFKEYQDQYPDFWQGQERTMVSIGQFSKILAIIKKNHANYFIMTGKITRPPWRAFLGFDWQGQWFFLRYLGLRFIGDNSLLSVLNNIVEEKTKARLLSDHYYLERKMPKGLWVGRTPTASMMADGQRGRKALAGNSKKEWGQAVVVADGAVVRFEKQSGTDAMLQAVKDVINDRQAVMVKDFKKQQDRRLDIPTIGPDTIGSAKKNGIRGIFFPHDGNIVAAKKVKRQAKKYKIFIYLF